MHILLWGFGIFFILTSILGYFMLVDAPWWYRMFITPWFWYLFAVCLFSKWLSIQIENSYQYGAIRKVMRWFGAQPYKYDFNKLYNHKKRFWRY